MPDQTDRIDRQIRNANIHAPKMAVSDLQAAKAEYERVIESPEYWASRNVRTAADALIAAYEAEISSLERCGNCKHVGVGFIAQVHCSFDRIPGSEDNRVRPSDPCHFRTPDNPHGKWEGVG